MAARCNDGISFEFTSASSAGALPSCFTFESLCERRRRGWEVDILMCLAKGWLKVQGGGELGRQGKGVGREGELAVLGDLF